LVLDPRSTAFYDRDVHDVARDLLGCVVRHGDTAGRIVETESYHQEEPACHAHIGLTARTHTLFEPPGIVYVYRSYGIHALLNAVTEAPGVGAAVLIRALEPTEGIDLMRARRNGIEKFEELCNGPGKLTQALGIDLDLNATPLTGGQGPIVVEPRIHEPEIVAGERIGITKAADLPWRFCDATSRCVSRPWPAAMRRRKPLARARRGGAAAATR
jgi:DNA-3-methyladenine glycosylase